MVKCLACKNLALIVDYETKAIYDPCLYICQQSRLVMLFFDVAGDFPCEHFKDRFKDRNYVRESERVET